MRLEQRISRNEAKVAALGELQTLLGAVKDGGRRAAQPAGPAGRQRERVRAQAGVPDRRRQRRRPADLVGVSLENAAAAGSFTLEVERLATAHKLAAQPLGAAGQTLADAWNGGAAFAGTLEVGLAGGAKATHRRRAAP